jgi:hypothetical protein
VAHRGGWMQARPELMPVPIFKMPIMAFDRRVAL